MPGKAHLFAVTHWLLKAASWLIILVAALLVLALGALVVMAIDGSQFGIPALKDGLTRIAVLELAGLAVACGLGCAILVLFAVRLTTGIVETAISGDPFVNENAERLMRIGWLLLTLDAVGIVAKPMFHWLTPEKLQGQINFGFDVSPISLFAVLLIFVLAQIFRRGSEMRAELAATV
jgi:Protein of unknown function (DUF2975)